MIHNWNLPDINLFLFCLFAHMAKISRLWMTCPLFLFWSMIYFIQTANPDNGAKLMDSISQSVI